MKQKDCIRQGDVLLRRIKALPGGLKQKDKVLALGEITGHKHQFTDEQVLVLADGEGKQFVDAKQEVMLEHEDHAHLKVPKGVYEVVIQREFTPLDGIRQVTD